MVRYGEQHVLPENLILRRIAGKRVHKYCQKTRRMKQEKKCKINFPQEKKEPELRKIMKITKLICLICNFMRII